ncbi:MAG: hypothetical protein ACLVH8_11170 [Fusobacterium sp.]|nr:hypothetical protein [Fusobacterium sp.]
MKNRGYKKYYKNRNIKLINVENKIDKLDVICDMIRIYDDLSLLQMELLEILETLDNIGEKTQNKILRAVNEFKFFEEIIDGYYMRIEYIKNKESSIRIIKI